MNTRVVYTVEGEIAIIQMIDRAGRNTFSRPFAQELTAAFNAINANLLIKVVVIYGYENYFCCGGTQEELLNIFSGKITFTDLNFYRLLLDCPVPVIAAMQGHAIGGGLVFGCYADLMILAEECIYSTNFMKYGFTPGMGATYIVPKKLGETIGYELLYTAETYYGGMLKAKNVPVPVVKKAEVITNAMLLAQQLADKPSHSLKLLKKHLTQEVRSKLPKIIEQELEMHRQTFANPEVKTRIESRFGQ